MLLPAHLAERLEPNAPAPRSGAYVVYWMRIACRVHDNPALDMALTAAQLLKLPVFIYHSISERYRYASDRLHTFILEGARDVEQACREKNIGYAFHLETAGGPDRVLEMLAEGAALVVTDFMPVQPMLTWDATVAKRAPVWRVDASCVAPVFRFQTSFERAFGFTEAATPVWRARLENPWVDAEVKGPAWLPVLPFTPLVLRDADLPSLVASCAIDHSVAPVHHTPGGTHAAVQRWERFREFKLATYDKDRTDPNLEGNSRLSAYLHFGHLSPFRIACETHRHRSEGAKKFLNELLTWRELGWNFCLHHPRPESIDSIVPWARETLKAHERDPRPALPSWEQLARAQTGNLLWDAAQRQLLTHGELHNTVRMTWGKQVISWSRTPQDALSALVDLNHRFALDGRDPASYAGILWCFGQFDRAFLPAVPILGTVRPRPTSEYGKRFDVAEYERRVRRPARGSALTVAVVGAGVAGAACARALSDAGHVVTLYDKGRRPGGRLSTREEGPLRFDHGAPYFTVRDERFARYARAWWQERVLTQWKGVIENETRAHAHELVKLVGAPGMSSVVRRMLHGLDVRFGVEVKGLTRDGSRWRLMDADGDALGEFDVAVVATPAPQAATLIDPSSYALASRLRSEVAVNPCWALMLHFEQLTGVQWDATFNTVGPLGFMARNSSKPERELETGESLVLHATSEWSRAHLEETPEQVAPQLLDAFFATTGVRRLEPTFIKAHRWRYSTTARPLGEPCVWDASMRLAVCGDWCLGSRVEDAFLSGSAAAGRILAMGGDLEESNAPPPLVSQLALL